MDKIEFKKAYKQYYQAKIEPEFVDIPELQFLKINGHGDPDAAEFAQAVEALYGLYYTIKFARKKAGVGPEYSSGPLEGLWWMENQEGFDVTKRDDWSWRLLLWVPDKISSEDLTSAKQELSKKKQNERITIVTLERFREGKAAQILHLGSYAEEGPTVEKLHRFIKENGRSLRGHHHEIYLGDPRRVAPNKLRTIIRHPVE